MAYQALKTAIESGEPFVPVQDTTFRDLWIAARELSAQGLKWQPETFEAWCMFGQWYTMTGLEYLWALHDDGVPVEWDKWFCKINLNPFCYSEDSRVETEVDVVAFQLWLEEFKFATPKDTDRVAAVRMRETRANTLRMWKVYDVDTTRIPAQTECYPMAANPVIDPRVGNILVDRSCADAAIRAIVPPGAVDTICGLGGVIAGGSCSLALTTLGGEDPDWNTDLDVFVYYTDKTDNKKCVDAIIDYLTGLGAKFTVNNSVITCFISGYVPIQIISCDAGSMSALLLQFDQSVIKFAYDAKTWFTTASGLMFLRTGVSVSYFADQVSVERTAKTAVRGFAIAKSKCLDDAGFDAWLPDSDMLNDQRQRQLLDARVPAMTNMRRFEAYIYSQKRTKLCEDPRGKFVVAGHFGSRYTVAEWNDSMLTNLRTEAKHDNKRVLNGCSGLRMRLPFSTLVSIDGMNDRSGSIDDYGTDQYGEASIVVDTDKDFVMRMAQIARQVGADPSPFDGKTTLTITAPKSRFEIHVAKFLKDAHSNFITDQYGMYVPPEQLLPGNTIAMNIAFTVNRKHKLKIRLMSITKYVSPVASDEDIPM